MTTSSRPLSREAILAEAARMFAERGYSQTRLRDIAGAFGVTHAALYYHFEQKEDILIKLNEDAMEGLMATQAEIADSEDTPLEEKFDHMLYAHALYVARNAVEVACLFDGEYALPQEFARWLRGRRTDYTNRAVQMFTAAQSAGRYRDGDPNMLVPILIGAATWSYRWYRPGGDWSPEHLAHETVQLVASGFLRNGVSLATPDTGGRHFPRSRTSTPDMF